MKKFLLALCGVAFLWCGGASAAELYAGENALLAEAKKEKGLTSYDTGPTWANWQALFEGFQERYGIEVAYNDLGSGATVVRLDKERNNPQGDSAYYFMPSGEAAHQKAVTEPFKPVNFDKIPDILKDPEGNWFCVHKMTVVFVVNKNLVKEMPKGWNDLLKPAYSKSIVYLDPRTAGIGYAIVLACVYAQGGDLDHPEAGVEYLAKLQECGNVRMIEKTTEFDKFVKGEIPVWITYDANAYRARYIAGLGDAVEIVIPSEGTITSPYAMSLVKGAPNPNTGKLWLNYILSEEGQGLFARGFVRPIIPGFKIPEDVADKFLSDADYTRAKDVDWVKAAEVQTKLASLWGSKVLGED
ncbi:MAG: extracellular solute-binding protein [Synergistaceae bacterium]|nr:extracellular solute-binding protein [Synergistaceae bacterium]